MTSEDTGTARTSLPRPSAIERLTGAVALLGGLLSLALASLVVVSVLGRWLISKPVEGDFEFVKMMTAVAVFAFLPYAQVRRANIIVDTFTSWLSERATRRIDALWDLVYAATMAVLGYCLVLGTRDFIRSGETTMMLQIALWPSILIATILCWLLVLASIATAYERLQGTP